ncbi:MAG: hypothetical protein FWD11_11195, partial [Micrococcales bacterium]|nr:hypothetical protein [Micrococcales bacterium]
MRLSHRIFSLLVIAGIAGFAAVPSAPALPAPQVAPQAPETNGSAFDEPSPVVPEPGDTAIPKALAGPAAAMAAPCIGGPWPAAGSPAGGFEIDGDLCTDDPDLTDWDTVPGQPMVRDGIRDSTRFDQGAAENNWPWSLPQISGTSPGGAGRVTPTDLLDVYAKSRIYDGDVWTYVGFSRAAGSGRVAYRVELNQRENSQGPVPARTAGDLRLTFEDSSTGVLRLVGAHQWSASGWLSLGTGAYVVQINQAPVSDLDGQMLDTGTFVELAVDLSSILDPTVCSAKFTTLNIRSSQSGTDTSSLEDWISPVPLEVPGTCPEIRVDKDWVIDGTTY